MMFVTLFLAAGLYQCAFAHFTDKCREDGTIDISGALYDGIGDYMGDLTNGLVKSIDNILDIVVNRFGIKDHARITRMRNVLNTCYGSCRSRVVTITADLEQCRIDINRILADFDSCSTGGRCTYTNKRSHALIDLKILSTVTAILKLDFLLKLNVLTTVTGLLDGIVELAGGLLGTVANLLDSVLEGTGLFGGGLLGGILGSTLGSLKPVLTTLKALLQTIGECVINVVGDLLDGLLRQLDGILFELLGINLFIIECDVKDSGRRAELCDKMADVISDCVATFKVSLKSYNRCIDGKYNAFARCNKYEDMLRACI